MTHPNAALTPRHRLKVARLVVEEGWPISEVAAHFQVSWPTVKRWVDRYLAGEPMHDRSSLPRTSPNKTSKAVTKRCVSLRMRLREGPVQRFHRTMADGSAYARCYTSEQERRGALGAWLHQYNQHRPHTACGNQPPFSRLINLPGAVQLAGGLAFREVRGGSNAGDAANRNRRPQIDAGQPDQHQGNHCEHGDCQSGCPGEQHTESDRFSRGTTVSGEAKDNVADPDRHRSQDSACGQGCADPNRDGPQLRSDIRAGELQGEPRTYSSPTYQWPGHRPGLPPLLGWLGRVRASHHGCLSFVSMRRGPILIDTPYPSRGTETCPADGVGRSFGVLFDDGRVGRFAVDDKGVIAGYGSSRYARASGSALRVGQAGAHPDRLVVPSPLVVPSRPRRRALSRLMSSRTPLYTTVYGTSSSLSGSPESAGSGSSAISSMTICARAAPGSNIS
ncbi:helix-turn-helix domain-containing protein [Rhodococcus sp. NPDC003348]